MALPFYIFSPFFIELLYEMKICIMKVEHYKLVQMPTISFSDLTYITPTKIYMFVVLFVEISIENVQTLQK